MRIFFDTEFYETGNSIHPISIGMVREDGAEYYAIFENFDLDRINTKSWLGQNVIPHLPVVVGKENNKWWDEDHPDYCYVMEKNQILDDVLQFTQIPDVELWAYFGSYDFVVLAQIFRGMMNMPGKLQAPPRDLVHLIEGSNVDEASLPKQKNQYKSIDDARWNRDVYNHIMGV